MVKSVEWCGVPMVKSSDLTIGTPVATIPLT